MLNPIFSSPLLTETLIFPLLKFMTQPIDLKTLLKSTQVLKIKGPKRNPLISNISLHSQNLQTHGLFLAIKGEHYNGMDFVEQAITAGAEVIVTETLLPHLPNIIQVQVKDIREAAAQIAHTFYQTPGRPLNLIGITGTSGKTTTSLLLQHIYQKALNKNCGLIGSLYYDLGNRILPASRTTPDVVSLNSYLHEMANAQKTEAIIEVSSHAIEQKRTYGLNFDTAVFTNLSLEHLDYHKTMEAYYQAKRQLFFQPHLKYAVINSDDVHGQRLMKELPMTVQAITIGIENPALLQAKDIKTNFEGTQFTLVCGEQHWQVKTKLLGLFNVYNCLAALGICYAHGYDLNKIIPIIGKFTTVPGRLEKVPNKLGLNVFVDYAHKPEALKNVLQTLRPLTKKRLNVVFGCGGDRDRSKRPVMTHIAETYADHAWATSDNPRTESQQQIFEDMRAGLQDKSKIDFITDRSEAIAEALKSCCAGDCLIIAGKGHEQYQEINQHFYPFDDRKIVEDYCRKALL